MLVQSSIDAVAKAKFGENFIRPLHEDWCFSRIPATLRNFFLNSEEKGLPEEAFPPMKNKPQKIVFLFIDALGWRFFNETVWNHPFIKRFYDDGRISKTTAQFPSTTIVHMTTMATGLQVAETGIMEWFYYEPNLGEVICPLPYCLAGERTPDTLKKICDDPYKVFPKSSLSEELTNNGVACYIYQNKNYTPSTFSHATMRGANMRPFDGLSQAISKLKQDIVKDEKSFHFLYIDSIDHIAHQVGPSSEETETEILSVLTKLNNELLNNALLGLKDTLVLATADHGQTDTDLGRVLYINKAWPEIDQYLRKTPLGKPIVPCGGMGRDMFLFVEPGQIQMVFDKLKQIVGNIGEVFLVKDFVEMGMFGYKPPTDAFKERCGDIVIVAYKGEAIWWYESGKFSIVTKGNHGGLTPEEMETPFLALAL